MPEHFILSSIAVLPVSAFELQSVASHEVSGLVYAKQWFGLQAHELSLGAHELSLGAHELSLGAHEMSLGAHELSLGAHELSLGAHELSLGAHELSLGAHELSLASHELSLGSHELSFAGKVKEGHADTTPPANGLTREHGKAAIVMAAHADILITSLSGQHADLQAPKPATGQGTLKS
ncbi:MAG: hypothetical protein RL748_747 [Pseudomonadota bacterium]|jgi:hypothetical protein